jgi:hypothetical protein
MAQTLDIAGAGTVGMAGNRAPFGLFKTWNGRETCSATSARTGLPR